MSTRPLITLPLLLALTAPLPLQAADSLGKDMRNAAAVGNTEEVMRHLDAGVPVDAPNEFGKTALMMAVEGDNLETVALLLARGADVNARASGNCTALTFAAENGHIGITALLIERGANLHDRTRGGWDALMIASRYGITDMVEQLLFKGADPKASDKEHRTAMMDAAARGHAQV
ncbi:MAG TPA: ankyrin repeat domain-containing protein, partial [Chromatiaceae bacterium]|nr:ankyrin repeat domain-containing protein [Chromatiaceae bacterium]